MPEKSMLLKIGFACNNNCLCCSQANRKPLGEMTFEQVKAFIEKGSKKGNSILVISGGEPTVRSDLVEICKFARKTGFGKIVLQSNGRMFSYPKLCKELALAGVTQFMIGIHGGTKQSHDFASQVPGAFEQVIQGIKNLKAINSKVAVNFILTKLNFKELPAAVGLFSSLGIDKCLISFVSCMGNAEKNVDLLLPRMSEVKPFVEDAFKEAEKTGLMLTICSYPLCFLKGNEKHYEGIYAPTRTVCDVLGERENFDDVNRKSLNQRGLVCSKCKYELVCRGPEKIYTKKFGWSEFKPVKGKKVKTINEVPWS